MTPTPGEFSVPVTFACINHIACIYCPLHRISVLTLTFFSYHSGTINLSRIDSCKLQLEFTNALVGGYNIFVYAKSINVVVINSGVAQLKFS